MWFSGHTIFLEEGVDIALIMDQNGMGTPPAAVGARDADGEAEERMDELGRFLEPWRVRGGRIRLSLLRGCAIWWGDIIFYYLYVDAVYHTGTGD